LSQNILEIDPTQISETRVLKTVMGGAQPLPRKSESLRGRSILSFEFNITIVLRYRTKEFPKLVSAKSRLIA